MTITPQTIQVRAIDTRNRTPSTHHAGARNARVVIIVVNLVLSQIFITLLTIETLHKTSWRGRKSVGSTRFLAGTSLSGVSQMLHRHSMGVTVDWLLLEPFVAVTTRLRCRRVCRGVSRRGQFHIVCVTSVSVRETHLDIHLVSKVGMQRSIGGGMVQWRSGDSSLAGVVILLTSPLSRIVHRAMVH